jgi:hypothetical protein
MCENNQSSIPDKNRRSSISLLHDLRNELQTSGNPSAVPKTIVIFDDCVGESIPFGGSKLSEDIFFHGRHNHISLLLPPLQTPTPSSNSDGFIDTWHIF